MGMMYKDSEGRCAKRAKLGLTGPVVRLARNSHGILTRHQHRALLIFI
jgi:hypothetical protein